VHLRLRYTKQKGGQPTGEANQLNILTTFKDICKQLRPYMCIQLEFELRARNTELRTSNSAGMTHGMPAGAGIIDICVYYGCTYNVLITFST